jgi:hypothetical protein
MSSVLLFPILLNSESIHVIQNEGHTQSVKQDYSRIAVYKKIEVEIKSRTISYQVLDHRDACERKGRDPSKRRNIPAKT